MNTKRAQSRRLTADDVHQAMSDLGVPEMDAPPTIATPTYTPTLAVIEMIRRRQTPDTRYWLNHDRWLMVAGLAEEVVG